MNERMFGMVNSTGTEGIVTSGGAVAPAGKVTGEGDGGVVPSSEVLPSPAVAVELLEVDAADLFGRGIEYRGGFENAESKSAPAVRHERGMNEQRGRGSRPPFG